MLTILTRHGFRKLKKVQCQILTSQIESRREKCEHGNQPEQQITVPKKK